MIFVKRSNPAGKLNTNLLNRKFKKNLSKYGFDFLLVKLKTVYRHNGNIVFV